MNRGIFITFEGGEGTGKSTQTRRLRDALANAGNTVLLTREPGGAPGAEAIRKLLVEGSVNRWSPLAETLLFAAARDEHLRQTIRPALESGTIVVCDRFADSTRAYQGVGSGVDHELVRHLEDVVVRSTRPHLTLILDLDPSVGLARVAGRSGAEQEARFEAKSLQFHQRLRAAFLDIATAEPERCAIVDASKPADAVAAAIIGIVHERLSMNLGAPSNGAERGGSS